ncbi:MAG: hypothetical protein ACYS8W_14040 [Planctomycetota bacterium]
MLSVLSIAAVLLSATGIGILLRRKWAVFLIQFITIFPYAVLLLVMPHDVIDAPARIRTGLLLSVLFFAAAGFFFLYLFWKFWRSPQTRYALDFTAIEELRKDVHAPTHRLGSFILAEGVCFMLFATGILLHVTFSGLHYPLHDEDVVVTIAVIVGGGVMIIVGLNFRRKQRWVRKFLMGLTVAGILSYIGLALFGLFGIAWLVYSVPAGFRQNFMWGFMLFLGYLFMCFITPGYFLLEVWRYLCSDKVKAYFGQGDYPPPWEGQYESFKKIEKGE